MLFVVLFLVFSFIFSKSGCIEVAASYMITNLIFSHGKEIFSGKILKLSWTSLNQSSNGTSCIIQLSDFKGETSLFIKIFYFHFRHLTKCRRISYDLVKYFNTSLIPSQLFQILVLNTGRHWNRVEQLLEMGLSYKYMEWHMDQEFKNSIHEYSKYSRIDQIKLVESLKGYSPL